MYCVLSPTVLLICQKPKSSGEPIVWARRTAEAGEDKENMSSRVFQSVIVQLKEATERCVGVADEQGFVIACSELSMIGSHLDDLPVAAAENAAALCGGLTAREKNCILAHMWPLSRRAPRSREAAAVCLADKLCATAEIMQIWRNLGLRRAVLSGA